MGLFHLLKRENSKLKRRKKKKKRDILKNRKKRANKKLGENYKMCCHCERVNELVK